MRIGRLVGRGFTRGRAVIAIMVMVWGRGALKRRMSGMGRLCLGRMRFGGRARRGSGMFGGVGCAGREGTCGVRGDSRLRGNDGGVGMTWVGAGMTCGNGGCGNDVGVRMT